MGADTNALVPVGHSPLGMSVLERRYACPGSMQAEEGRPDRPSRFAERGSSLHAVAAECLADGTDAIDAIPWDGDGAEIVQAYLDVVREAHRRMGGQLLIEHRFSLRGLHQLYWGTADAVIVAPPVLWVCDLKTGAGHAVPVRRPDGRVNFQLGGYGLGALQTVPVGVRVEEVELVVVQPRNGGVTTTTMTADETLDLAGDLVLIAQAATAPDAPRIAGDHCTFCRASGDCPALREQALAVAVAEFAEPPPPSSLSPLEVGLLLARADVVDVWVAALRAHAKDLADAGTEVPGWKLVDRRGRRIWSDEEAAAASLFGAGVSGDDLHTRKLVSPAQAEKALKRLRLRKPAEWNDLVKTTDPGTALAPMADRRPAVAARSSAELDFTIETESTET